MYDTYLHDLEDRSAVFSGKNRALNKSDRLATCPNWDPLMTLQILLPYRKIIVEVLLRRNIVEQFLISRTQRSKQRYSWSFSGGTEFLNVEVTTIQRVSTLSPRFFHQGHEGPGSLLSYLKKKNWANAVGVDASSATDDFTIFEVRRLLVSVGLELRCEI